MNKTHLKLSLAAVAAAAALAACGGGGSDHSGGATPTDGAFTVIPDTITLTGPDADTCGAGFSGEVFVYGGTPPYRIDNTLPGVILLSTDKVDRRGGSFQIMLPISACLDNIAINVVDSQQRLITMSVNSVEGTD